MAAIRAKNTKPEITVRKFLHKKGFRFRIHSGLPGKPDIVLRKYNAIIWINGCFWHGHDCKFFKMPKTRREFWEAKISETRIRDERNLLELRSEGWRQIVVWECALKGDYTSKTLTRIERWLLSGRKFTEI